MREQINTHTVLVDKPEKGRPLGRPRLRSEDNIKMDLKTKACDAVSWIRLAQDREKGWALSNMILKFRVRYSAGKLFTSGGTISCSRRTLLRRGN